MSPMNNRLLRPRQTVHPEAADWASRVRTNGGSVSGTTLTAVDKFVKAVYTAGIRDRFYRLNLFCGTGLSACLVPLFRSASFGGTTFGSATDTNNNFVAGDYAETGASGGLLGDATSKFLQTGFSVSSLPNNVSGHMGAYKNNSMPFVRSLIGVRAGGSGDLYRAMTFLTNTFQAAWGNATSNSAADATYAQSGMFVTNFASGTLSGFWKGVSVTSASISPALNTDTSDLIVFGDGAAGSLTSARLRCYSTGLGMTASQQAAYNSAIVQFQTALGRA